MSYTKLCGPVDLAYLSSNLQEPDVRWSPYAPLPVDFLLQCHKVALSLNHRWSERVSRRTLATRDEWRLDEICDLTQGEQPNVYSVYFSPCFYHETPVMGKVHIWQVPNESYYALSFEQKARLNRPITERWADHPTMLLDRGGTDEWGEYQPTQWYVADTISHRVCASLEVKAQNARLVDTAIPYGQHTRSWLDEQWAEPTAGDDDLIHQAACTPDGKFRTILEAFGLYGGQIWTNAERKRMGLREMPERVDFTPPAGHTIRYDDSDNVYRILDHADVTVAKVEVLDRDGESLYLVRSTLLGPSQSRVYYTHTGEPLLLNTDN